MRSVMVCEGIALGQFVKYSGAASTGGHAKVLIEEGRRTVYLRVYSGKVAEGDVVLNAATGVEEKVARLFRIHAAKKERIEEAKTRARNNGIGMAGITGSGRFSTTTVLPRSRRP